MRMIVRQWIAPVMAFAIGIGAAAAQPLPARPITMVVPFPAGGPTDVLARILAEHMRGSLGQTVIVENVAGVGGATGSGRVARAAPDGTQLIFSHMATHVILPATTQLNYDVTRDFEPVALVADTPQGIIGKASLPARNLAELTAWLKQNPGKATMGSIGVAGPSDVSAIFFQQKTGTSFQLVPYRGGAPLLQDLVGGQIDLGLFLVPAFLEQMRAGQIRGYAVLAKRRMAAAPDLPTIEEAGGPELTSTVWHALWAPKGTPKETVAALNAAAAALVLDSKGRFVSQSDPGVFGPAASKNFT